MDEKVIFEITLNTINIMNKLLVMIGEVCDNFCLNWDDLAQYYATLVAWKLIKRVTWSRVWESR